VSKEEELYEGCDKLVRSMKKRYKGWDGVKQFNGTTDRLYRLYQEFCWTPHRIETEVGRSFKKFDSDFHQMVVGGPWIVHALCPHHFVVCEFKVWTGYLPNKQQGKVVGLSKLARVSEIMAKRPIIQEQYTEDVAKKMIEGLETDDVAVYVKGSHGCITSRGVKQQGEFFTSFVEGCFKNEDATRNEFLAIVRNGG